MIASVVINLKNSKLDRTFDYLVPSEYEKNVEIGMRVYTNFGSNKIVGFIIDLKEESDYPKDKLKYLDSIIDLKPLISVEMIELAKYIANHNFSFLYEVLEMMIPTMLKSKVYKILHVKNYDLLDDRLKELFKFKDKITYTDSLKEYQSLIYKNIKNNNLILDYELKDSKTIKTVKYLRFDNEINKVTKKGQMVIDFLKEANQDIALSFVKEELNISDSVINTLIKNENVKLIVKEEYRSVKVIDTADKNIIFNDYQDKVYQGIKKYYNTYKPILIHGITGSGKTEIYLKIIEDIIQSGKEAIMLVPEIVLTPQLASRFKSRLKEKVAIIHSKLSPGEKYDEYRRIENNEAKVVVGARSSIFSPFKNLGVIIMDEEQEESYVQNNNPRYDTHDLAIFRAKYNNCPVIFGSATPKVETYYKALNDEYKLFEIPVRANNKPLPKAKLIDLRYQGRRRNYSAISDELKDAIIDNYSKGEQSILFINRRGYSTFMMCRACGEVIKCPNCDLSLTYHKTVGKLKCHCCGYQQNVVDVCPNCKSDELKFVGDGTQRVEEELAKILPEARVIRMDLDSVTAKDSYQEIISKINNHEADILLGTQMIAKGLDFPLVSLVGVINADLGLNMPLYDAYEKTYDLIEQVSGRAGRKDTDGKVFIQTYHPENIVISSAFNHSYKAFYLSEIEKRKNALYPPFKELIEVMVSALDPDVAFKNICKVKNILVKNKKLDVLGPVSDRIYKKNNRYRYILTIRKDFNDSDSDFNNIKDITSNISDIEVSIRRL